MPAAKTILLIEDDREIQSTISGVLQAAGYDVRVAPNGIEGQRRVEEQRPDLIITDMMMPRMGGFPVLEFLKGLPDAPPVIMITANEGGRHKAYAEMLGVADYLRKPFAMDVMLESVAKAIRAAESKSPSSEGGDRLRRAVRKKAAKKDEEE
jgi:DNA-binding response OmpR family regulator